MNPNHPSNWRDRVNDLVVRKATGNCLYSGPSKKAAEEAAKERGQVYWTGKVWLAATPEQFGRLYPNGLP